jgi:hypothetical protein
MSTAVVATTHVCHADGSKTPRVRCLITEDLAPLNRVTASNTGRPRIFS